MIYMIIKGYCSPDNYTSDDGPILEISECKTKEEVEKDYKEWCDVEEYGHGGKNGGDYSSVTYRVFEVNKKLFFKAKRIVEEWKLEG